MDQTPEPDIQRSSHRFFWWRIFILQTFLMTSVIMPVYGFNALIRPVNAVFHADSTLDGWPGALAGGVMFLGLACGYVLTSLLTKVGLGFRGRWITACGMISLCLVVAAIACWTESLPLLLLGGVFPVGVGVGCCFMHSANLLLSWGRYAGHLGLQSGMFGLMFGLWGAAFSLLATLTVARWGLEWTLVGTAVLIMVLSLVSLINMQPPPAATPQQEANIPRLTFRRVLGSKTLWLVFVFLLIFLTPGFGFKVIVQSLSQRIYHVSDLTASLVAVAFLVSYGVSRLVCGLVADHLSLKGLILFFTAGQCLLLAATAIGLPLVEGIAFLTVMMCLVGALFAAGKSLWGMLLITLFGPSNLNVGIGTTLPAFGLAGLIGPLSLNWALRSDDVLTMTSWWLYIMAAAMAIAVIIVWLLRKFDFEATHQALHFRPSTRDQLDRF
ncbi:MAG: hypothetical protein MK116_04480 [Phycisphaerales bacterium]|nr:hypothetical protein [Phycisphaerales bacterium]